MTCCPYCDGCEIHPSERRGLFDLLLRWAGRHPFVCAECKTRFFLREAPPVRERRAPEPVPINRTARPCRPDAREAVDCTVVDGAWVPETPRREEPASPFPDTEYICPPELALHLVSLLETVPAEPAPAPRIRVRRRATA